MNKASKTERALFDALDLLVSGNPARTDGAFTQENIAKEAGVTRATFNRYDKVVEEYQRIKRRHAGTEDAVPLTIQDQNRALQETHIQLQRTAADNKAEYTKHLVAARDEIMVLTLALRKRDETIAAKERIIAELNKKLVAQARKSKPGHLGVVE